MSIDVIDIVNDSDLAFNFSLQRYSGTFEQGGYVETGSTVNLWGPVQPTSDEEALMVPESDRVTGMKTFWCQQVLLHTNPVGTGDVISWDGNTWKVLYVKPWPENGYYRAIASRLEGE